MLWYKIICKDLVLNSNIDPFIANVNRVLPDVGAGIYLTHDYFYVGVSVPNFIKSSLYNKSTIDNISASNASKVKFAHRTPHFFFMAGGVIPAGKVLKIRPQILGKYIIADQGKKIPFQMDFNLSLLIYNRVNIGGTYRTAFHNKKTGLTNGDSFDVMLEVWPMKQFMIGYAYDYTLTKLGDYNKGSHEII
ncbi:MAG: PorP/SprF family type IX secretion system membrane protein [Saprospirales bacterium]|nr:PorP/SprF family type IX secretion system membrane protein [Saprospirales bacterium]